MKGAALILVIFEPDSFCRGGLKERAPAVGFYTVDFKIAVAVGVGLRQGKSRLVRGHGCCRGRASCLVVAGAVDKGHTGGTFPGKRKHQLHGRFISVRIIRTRKKGKCEYKNKGQ